MKKYTVTISFCDGRKVKFDSDHKPLVINKTVRVGEILLMPNTINYFTHFENKKTTSRK